MALLLLAAFVVIPIVEISLFIEVGGRIGVVNTLALVVLTAVIGTALLRSQGLVTLNRARDSLARNVLPVAELFDGICLLVAGVLLVTPGFFTDAMGFLLLIPPVRRSVRNWLWRALQRSGGTRVWVNGEEVTRPRPDGGTIDGEYHVVDKDEPERPDDSPRLPR